MRPNLDELRVKCRMYGCDWTPEAMRCAYEAIVESWGRAGLLPDKLATHAPTVRGIGNRWGSYRHKCKRLEATGFVGVEHVSLSHLADPTDSRPNDTFMYPDVDYKVHAYFGRTWQSARLEWIPSVIGRPAGAFFDLYRAMFACGKATYGYLGHQAHTYRSLVHPPGTPNHDCMSNSQRWTQVDTTHVHTLLLRNVFPRNFLSEAHLDAPFGLSGLSLRDWIRASPAERGSMRPFCEGVTEWSPPPLQINTLREQLFRAGRLFCDSFFHEIDLDYLELNGRVWRLGEAPPGARRRANPLYRSDIFAPWESPDPIPAYFRADYDGDPECFSP